MSTASLVLSERLRTTTTISSVNLSVCSASFLISSATTAKPFPASPALAASMAAFNARRLVCPAIDLIMVLASSIFFAPSSVLTITSLTFMADSSTFAVVFIRSLIADIPFSLASYTPSEELLSSTIDSSFALSASPMLCIALVPLCISSAWCIAPIEIPSTALVSSSEALAVLFALSAISSDTLRILPETSLMLSTMSLSLSTTFSVPLDIEPISSFLPEFLLMPDLTSSLKS